MISGSPLRQAVIVTEHGLDALSKNPEEVYVKMKSRCGENVSLEATVLEFIIPRTLNVPV